MKIKFSRTLAIACILCMTFATLTAFAAETEVQPNEVTTITNYDLENGQASVETTVKGVSVDDEITYYVYNDDKIVYIDQATAKASSVNFTFVADKTELVKASTLAKNGSNKGYKFPEFKFNESCNYMTQGSANIEPVVFGDADTDTKYGDGTGYIYQGKVSGTVTAYGIKVDGVEYPALGCDQDGNFVIVLEGITADEFDSLQVEWFKR